MTEEEAKDFKRCRDALEVARALAAIKGAEIERLKAELEVANQALVALGQEHMRQAIELEVANQALVALGQEHMRQAMRFADSRKREQAKAATIERDRKLVRYIVHKTLKTFGKEPRECHCEDCTKAIDAAIAEAVGK